MSQIDVHYLRVGRCRHLECIAARGGDWKMVDFPSFCGLIRHPDVGWILFDTGYADHFYQATKKLPESLYRIALPVDLPEEEKLLTQLNALGINAEDIRLIVVSHYHGDHIAGLKDFPNAHFIASRKDSNNMQSLLRKPWRATLQGKLPSLLPQNYFQCLRYAEDYPVVDLPAWMQPFEKAYDLIGDGRILLIPLPGHSHGQLGLFINDDNQQPIFMVADACWSLKACKESRLPALPARIATDNIQAYKKTFDKLGEVANREGNVAILPSHCTDSWQRFNDGNR